MNIIIALIIALIAPIVLIPVEHVLNYPFVIEELIKFIAICIIILHSKQIKGNYWIFALLVGIIFTVSESILYISDYLIEGELSELPLRLFLTGTLHSTTSSLMYAAGRKSWLLLILAVIASIVIHYYFNYFVSRI